MGLVSIIIKIHMREYFKCPKSAILPTKTPRTWCHQKPESMSPPHSVQDDLWFVLAKQCGISEGDLWSKWEVKRCCTFRFTFLKSSFEQVWSILLKRKDHIDRRWVISSEIILDQPTLSLPSSWLHYYVRL